MENIVSDIFARQDDTSDYRTSRLGANPINIKVVGVGGGGGNAVNRMIQTGLSGVEFWLMNTDLQVLAGAKTDKKVQLGATLTKGLGAGNDPSVGEKAAEEAQQEITQALEGADMVFITAGMGGGTGTGAAPIVAKIAKQLGILTIAVVTKPFAFEGNIRANNANAGLEKLKDAVDAVIVVPNDKLLQVVDRQVSMEEAFIVADEVLIRGVTGITDIIKVPGIINVDFADVKAVMQGSGTALMGIGKASGEGRAVKAAQLAINSQLLESSINGASGVIVNITGGPDMGIHEVSDAASIIHDAVLDDATVIIGTAVNESIQGEIQITVIATGIEVKNNPSLSLFGSSSLNSEDKLPEMNTSSFFTGAFNTQTKSVLSNNNFTNIEIPDFLKR